VLQEFGVCEQNAAMNPAWGRESVVTELDRWPTLGDLLGHPLDVVFRLIGGGSQPGSNPADRP
jgi:hypothetical protein